MRICVVATAQQAQDIDFNGKTAVVIDVLRATSVVTTALDNGAQEVIAVKTVEQAQSLYAASNPANTLRGGERNALKIDGFDLSNSPMEYKKQVVEGKTIIFTTTNGTNAINNIKGAKEIVLACFRNAQAIVDYIAQSGRDTAIVCAGTEGRFSLDDGLCAGMLIELLKQQTAVEADDLGLLVTQYYNQNKTNLLGALSCCYHLRRLFALGFYDDIRFCLETSCVTTVPEAKEDKIKKKRIS